MLVIPAIGQVMTKGEAAKFLRVTTRTIDNYVYSGVGGRKLPRVQRGGRFFFRRSDLKSFVAVEVVTAGGDQPLPRIDNAAAKEELRRRGYEI